MVSVYLYEKWTLHTVSSDLNSNAEILKLFLYLLLYSLQAQLEQQRKQQELLQQQLQMQIMATKQQSLQMQLQQQQLQTKLQQNTLGALTSGIQQVIALLHYCYCYFHILIEQRWYLDISATICKNNSMRCMYMYEVYVCIILWL